MRALGIVAALLAAGCGSGGNASRPSGGGTGGVGTGTPGSGTGTGTGTGAAADLGEAPGGAPPPAPGTLTAGTWDDNLNFDFYREYLAELTSLPDRPDVPRDNRLAIHVVDGGGVPVPGATVSLASAGAQLWSSTTGADGLVWAFPAWDGVAAGAPLAITASAGGVSVVQTATVGDNQATLALAGAATAPPAALDVALVLDTTGSMGDELSYLEAELDGIVAALALEFPGVSQRWALVVYRDEKMNDDYEVRTFDFTADTAALTRTLSQQTAAGGGDIPEIPDRGLDAAMGLSWRGGATARVAFLIADAPYHPGREGKFVDAIAHARSAGVHVYPVSASGSDELVEYAFRSAAQLSGGRYLFLTDDSGVGDPHLAPTLPCYLVTKLSLAMERMIAMELTGTHLDPAPADVIRTGGDPHDRRCTLGDGSRVVAY